MLYETKREKQLIIAFVGLVAPKGAISKSAKSLLLTDLLSDL